MRKLLLGLVIAAMMPTLAADPAAAQNRREIRREYRQDVREARRERRQALRDWRQSRRYDWNRLEAGQRYYYPDRYYRDGRYYCRRSDGTTGLIIGGAVGALLGNAIDGGRSSLLGTLIGGAAGAALGREVERGQVRCR